MSDTSLNQSLPCFSGTNYSVWKFRVHTLLKKDNLFDVSQTEPTAANQQENSWINKNARACNVIVRCLADSHVDYVVEETSAYGMFQKLDAVFNRKTIGTKIYLRKTLTSLKCHEGQPLELFFKQFETAARSFKSAGGTLDELEEIILLLSAMPESYESVVTALETLDESALTIDRVKSRLLECELKMSLDHGNKSNHTETPVAFGAMKKNKCFHCGKNWFKGHKCQKKWKKQSYNSSKNNENPKSRHDETSFAMMTSGNIVQKQEFHAIIDSGCTDHILNHSCLPPDYKNLQNSSHSINIAKQGEQMIAKKAENLSISTFVNGQERKVTLNDVLVVDDNRVNMISVSQIDKRGGKVVFEGGKATIYMNEHVIGTATLENGLYQYSFNIIPTSSAHVSNSNNEFDLWHKRFGHLNKPGLSKMINKQMVDGIHTHIHGNKNFCETCTVAKQNRNPFDSTRKRAKRPLELVHTDVCGPSKYVSYDDKRYFVTFIDDYTHMTAVYLMKEKSEVFECFKSYKAMSEAYHNVKLYRLRCDQGGEYSSNEMKNFCKQKGVRIEYTPAYTSQSNGVAERMNRTLVEKGRSLLTDAKLPKNLWGEALLTATYLTNRSITNAVENKTPYEMWYKSKPNVSKLKVFGCQTFVMIPSAKRSKYDNKSYKCVLVGYGDSGYRLFDPNKQQIVYSRDVKFNENVLGLDDSTNDFEIKNEPTADDSTHETTVIDPNSPHSIKVTPTNTSTPFSPRITQTTQNPTPATVINRNNPPQHENDPPVITTTRYGRPVRRPLIYDEYETEFDSHCAFNAISDAPKDYDDVAGREDEELWINAIDDEIKSLNDNETWNLVKNPGNLKLLGTRWIFKKKTGVESKYKARLVAKGYLQKANVDYSETYAPVARLSTIRLLLSVGLQYNMDFYHMDVKTAFLHGRIGEDIYLKPPDGVDVPEGYVLKLNKSLYGLKQSPKMWNDRFDEFVTKIGFERSTADYCLYVKINDKSCTYIVLYVDDLLICSNDDKSLNEIKRNLSSEFEMKDLGPLKCFMGINIHIDKKNGSIKIEQKEYIENLLKKFGMYDCNGIQTPMEENLKLIKNDDVNLATNQPYREMLGSIMYLMLASRPDLCYAISYLSRFQEKATDLHFKHLKRVVRYVKQTSNVILEYHRDTKTPLTGYVDADWANDTTDRKSTSGYVFQVFGNPISWSSKKQMIIAKSTCEAEYVALSEACGEGIWLSKVITDLGIDPQLPFTIYEDNAGAIFMAQNPETKRSKHIDVKYHWIRQQLWDKKIKLEHVASTNQIADMMTKPLSRILFWKFLELLGLYQEGVLSG